MGGYFTTIGGQSRNNIAKLNTTTGEADATFNPNASNDVYSLALSGSDLYVGGYFTTIGGQSRNRIAKLNTTTGEADATFNPNANNVVRSLALSGSDLYVGGQFTQVAGQTRNRLAKVNATTGILDESFNPNVTKTTREDNFAITWSVLSLALSGEYLYIGGSFAYVGGQSRNNLAKVNAQTGDVIADPYLNIDYVSSDDYTKMWYEVKSLVIDGPNLYVGGFISYSANSISLARFYDPDPNAPTITLTPLSTPTNNPIVTGTATDTVGTITSVEYKVDSGSFTSCTSNDASFDEATEDFTCNPGTLTKGNHTLYFRSTDSSTNTTEEADYTTLAITVDLTAPSLTVNPLTNNLTNDTTPTFQGSSTDSDATISTIEFRIDSGSFETCTASDGTFDSATETFQCTPSSALTEGPHTLFVRGTDSTGNTTQTDNYLELNFTVDTSAPDNEVNKIDLTFGNTTNEQFEKTKTLFINKNKLKLKGTSSEASNGKLEIYKKTISGRKKLIKTIDIDANGDWNIVLTEFKNDKKTVLYFKTIDQAGNISDLSRGYEVTLDRKSPSFKKTNTKNAQLYSATPISITATQRTINFEATDDETGIAYYKVGVLQGNTLIKSLRKQQSTFYTLQSEIKPGAYTFLIRAYDRAGNRAEKRVLMNVR